MSPTCTCDNQLQPHDWMEGICPAVYGQPLPQWNAYGGTAPARKVLPSDPDPNAVEVSPGTWQHWGIFLRGSR